MFHADELAAQSLAGLSANGASIRPYMPDQHREFFAILPYLFIATTDQGGWPVGSVLTGAPGFVRSPDPTTLVITAPPTDGVAVDAEVGLLGLDLTNRRRNRANGQVVAVTDAGFTVAIRQSFGNCPKYIQTRKPVPHAVSPGVTEHLSKLDGEARRVIARADTFFVASRSRADASNGGLDISHRGGRSGFIDLRDDTLVIPEFRGNRYFNTLGNLLGDPRAGLLFLDFATGDLLQIQGRVTVDWTPDPAVTGAVHTWRLRVESVTRRRSAFPFTWTFGAYAPTTLATGAWEGERGLALDIRDHLSRSRTE